LIGFATDSKQALVGDLSPMNPFTLHLLGTSMTMTMKMRTEK